jgi:hypothetical protein
MKGEARGEEDGGACRGVVRVMVGGREAWSEDEAVGGHLGLCFGELCSSDGYLLEAKDVDGV